MARTLRTRLVFVVFVQPIPGGTLFVGEVARRVNQSFVTGTSSPQRFITGAQTPSGVAVDKAHIYWTNSATNSIGRANLDGLFGFASAQSASAFRSGLEAVGRGN